MPEHHLAEVLSEGEVRARDAAPVEADRHAQSDGLLPDRVVDRVVPRPAVDQAGADEGSLEAALDVAGEFVDRGGDVVRRQHGRAEDLAGPLTLCHEIGHPVVVGGGDGRGETRLESLRSSMVTARK